MTKQEFIIQLKVELLGLPQSEIDDIVRDQEEFIREAVSSGRREEDVINSLGSPSELAKNLKAEIKIDRAQTETKLGAKISGVLGAALAVLVLAPFNLIFVLGPLLGLIGILVGGWVAAVVVAAVFVTAIAAFFGLVIWIPASFLTYVSIFFTFVGGAAMGLTAIGVMYFVSILVAQLVLKYLRWNLNFIKSRT